MSRGLSCSLSEHAIVVDSSIGRNLALPPPDALRDRRHSVAPPNVLHGDVSLPHRRSQGMYHHHERRLGGREARAPVGRRGPYCGARQARHRGEKVCELPDPKLTKGQRSAPTELSPDELHARSQLTPCAYKGALARGGCASPSNPCRPSRPFGAPGSGPARRRPPPPRSRPRRCRPRRAGRRRPRGFVSAAGYRPLVRLSTSPNRP